MDEEELNGAPAPEAGQSPDGETTEGDSQTPPAEGEDAGQGEDNQQSAEGENDLQPGDTDIFGDDPQNPDGEGTEGEEGSEEDGDGDSYDATAMGEVRNRKIIFDQLTSLQDIFGDISRMSDHLFTKKKLGEPQDYLPKNIWDKVTYINQTAEEKLEQIDVILTGDIITKMSVEKLRKIFLALQRIASSLIDLLEQADRTLENE